MVKNLLAMQETRVRSLHREDSLEEGMATHSSILAWRIPPTEEPGVVKNSLGVRLSVRRCGGGFQAVDWLLSGSEYTSVNGYWWEE